MSKPGCPRLWEAEAVEDKRLRDVDRESFDRHRAGCLECRAAVAHLETVRDALEALPVPSPSPLARLRVRAAILREANRSVTHARGARRLVFVALAALLAAASLLFVVQWHGRTRVAVTAVSNPAAAESPTFRVDAEAAARLTTRASGSTTILALEDGRASFEVAHLGRGQRFVVALPDGEVEVRGTTFAIDVALNATRSVAVSSGRVALRLAGQGEIVLAAGERWPAPILAAAAEDDAGRHGSGASASAPAHAATTKWRATDAGERFDDAMRRFGAGQYAEADRQLAAFVRDHPADPRCEDAAFVRAVARSRLGDREGASLLAASYLRAYPQGLRRAEAQRLVDAGPH